MDETLAVLAVNIIHVGNVMAVDPFGGRTAERRGLDTTTAWGVTGQRCHIWSWTFAIHTRVRVGRDIGALVCFTRGCAGNATHREVPVALGFVFPARRRWRRATVRVTTFTIALFQVRRTEA